VNIGIAASNPARDMDLCPRFSVLCCPVSVEALRCTDPPTKESYQMSIGSSKSIKEGQGLQRIVESHRKQKYQFEWLF
jgi:hypothetical protein